METTLTCASGNPVRKPRISGSELRWVVWRRKTAVKRQDLIGLEKHLRLHAQHGGAVLSVSATLAVVLQQTRPKVCACDYNVGTSRSVTPFERVHRQWGGEGA